MNPLTPIERAEKIRLALIPLYKNWGPRGRAADRAMIAAEIQQAVDEALAAQPRCPDCATILSPFKRLDGETYLSHGDYACPKELFRENRKYGVKEYRQGLADAHEDAMKLLDEQYKLGQSRAYEDAARIAEDYGSEYRFDSDEEAAEFEEMVSRIRARAAELGEK